MQPSNIVISFIVPTHDRPQCLAETLSTLAQLAPAWPAGEPAPEVIVVDNASTSPAAAGPEIVRRLNVRIMRRPTNEAAAGRNAAAQEAAGDWLVMLDDDSHPTDWRFLEVLADLEDDIAAVGANIRLPTGCREAGGLPEVFIGCGVAIRREVFLEVGGYDPAFHYYAEEYDLAARLLLRGWRVVHDCRFSVRHHKTASGRDLNRITQRLVRNNGWVTQRYAPEAVRVEALHEVIARYAAMAVNESAGPGFVAGMTELMASLVAQPRAAMDPATFDRFTGLQAAREGLWADADIRAAASVSVVDAGKNAWVVRQALHELGKRILADEREAEALVIGTLSPGPMMDAIERRQESGRPVVMPWTPRGFTSLCSVLNSASG